MKIAYVVMCDVDGTAFPVGVAATLASAEVVAARMRQAAPYSKAAERLRSLGLGEERFPKFSVAEAPVYNLTGERVASAPRRGLKLRKG